LKHFASPAFWSCYRRLPSQIQRLADTSYELLKADPSHPSLHFKRIGKYRAVRVGFIIARSQLKFQKGCFGFG
jgi:hypothetical protein